MSLMDKIRKSNTIDEAEILRDSKFFVEEYQDTGIPILNVALSGRLDGGFHAGMTTWAGESRTFKSMFMLCLLKKFLDSHPDGVGVIYDNEFGTNKSSMEALGLDTSRILHKPIKHIEQLKLDLVKLLDDADRGDKIFIGVDSFGEIASLKETEDAIEGKTVTDMTRAKALNGLCRMIKPVLNIKNIHLFGIAKTYLEQGKKYPTAIVAGGTGITKQSDSQFIISKRQIKDGKEHMGSEFILTVSKGRLVKEKSKFVVEVTWEGGINKYSGLLDIAVELGFVTRPNNRTYLVKGNETKFSKKQTKSGEFWDDLLVDEEFKEAVYNRYSLGSLEGSSDEDDTIDPDPLELLEG